MQNSVAPVSAVCLAASTSDGMSSHAARTGESNRPDCEQKWQSSGQPPVLSETMPSTSTSGPHQRIRTSWASCSSGVERLVGQPQHLEDLLLGQPSPRSRTWSRAMSRISNLVVVTARESAIVPPSAEASP